MPHRVFPHDIHLSYEGDGEGIHVDPIADDECSITLGNIQIDMHPDNAADLRALLGEYLAAHRRGGVRCQRCNGSGQRTTGAFPPDRTTCPKCGGSGRVAA